MRQIPKSQVIRNLMGSARLFASVVHDLTEGAVLHETAGDHLTLARLDVLQLVEHCPNCTVSHVATFLGTSNAAASKLVDKLVRSGFLSRSHHENDRRSHLLRLTALGARVLRRFTAAQAHALSVLFAPIEDSRIVATAELLDEVAARLVGREVISEKCLQCGAYVRGECGPRRGQPERCVGGAKDTATLGGKQFGSWKGQVRRMVARRRRRAA
jgi:DNA-binding MarR family transcriptional regulator